MSCCKYCSSICSFSICLTLLIVLYNKKDKYYMSFLSIFLFIIFCIIIKNLYKFLFNFLNKPKPKIFNKNAIAMFEKNPNVILCIICLEDVENGIKLPCNCSTAYHEDCICEWFNKKIECPICKSTNLFQKNFKIGS